MHLILGASGSVGNRVARRLLERGESVRAVSRSQAKLADLKQLGATPVRGDVRTSDWMPAALKGVKSVVLAAHGLYPPTRDNHPGVTDDLGNRRIIESALQAGVEHVVFVSIVTTPGSQVLFGQAKLRTEEFLKVAGIAHTIIRPTVFIETHGVMMLGEPVRAKGTALFFGAGATTLNWISADDVADYIVHILQTSEPRNRTCVIGGPDYLSRLQVLAIIEEELGRSARRRHVPVAVLRTMKVLAGAFNPGLRYLLDFAIAEATTPEDPAWAPRTLDWTGRASVSDVVHRWAKNVR